MAVGRAIKAGRAAIELFLDDRVAARQLRSFGRRFRAIGLGLAGVGVSAAGLGATITAPFLGAIKAAGDFNETLNQFRETFGEQSEAAEDFATTFGKQVGRAKGDLLGFLSLAQGNLLQLGLDPSTTRELSQQLTELSVDLGSFFNVADEDAFGRLISGLNGSSEVLEKFNIDIKQSALETELLNQGIKLSEASEGEKRMARLAIILRSTAAAQGDATRTSDSFSNQLKALGANVRDSAVSIGQVFIPVAEKFLQQLNAGIVPIQEFVKNNEGLVIAAAAAGGALLVLGGALITVGAAATAAAAGFSLLATVVGTIGAPALLVVGALSAIGLALFDWEKAWQSTIGFIDSDVKPAIAGIATFLNAQDFEKAGELMLLTLQVGIEKGLAKAKKSIIEGFLELTPVGLQLDSLSPEIREFLIPAVTEGNSEAEQQLKRQRDILIEEARKTQAELDRANAERQQKDEAASRKREEQVEDTNKKIADLFEDVKSPDIVDTDKVAKDAEKAAKEAFSQFQSIGIGTGDDLQKSFELARDAISGIQLPNLDDFQQQLGNLQFKGGIDARSSTEGDLASRIFGTGEQTRTAEANLRANEKTAEQVQLLNDKITNNEPVFGVA